MRRQGTLTQKRFWRLDKDRIEDVRTTRLFHVVRYGEIFPTSPTDPWLTRHAVRLLEDWLRPSDVGLEWGAGRSTVWFARRVRRLTSVEDNLQWFTKVQRLLESQGLDSATLHHAPVETEGQDRENPLYLRLGRAMPDSSLDFILVDGVLRDRCTEVAMSKLKPGGLLIIDNANWYLPHVTHSPASLGAKGAFTTRLWSELSPRLMSWRHIWTTNGVFDTAFFVRPVQVAVGDASGTP